MVYKWNNDQPSPQLPYSQQQSPLSPVTPIRFPQQYPIMAYHHSLTGPHLQQYGQHPQSEKEMMSQISSLMVQCQQLLMEKSLLKQRLIDHDMILKLHSELNRVTLQNDRLRKENDILRQQLQMRSSKVVKPQRAATNQRPQNQKPARAPRQAHTKNDRANVNRKNKLKQTLRALANEPMQHGHGNVNKIAASNQNKNRNRRRTQKRLSRPISISRTDARSSSNSLFKHMQPHVEIEEEDLEFETLHDANSNDSGRRQQYIDEEYSYSVSDDFYDRYAIVKKTSFYVEDKDKLLDTNDTDNGTDNGTDTVNSRHLHVITMMEAAGESGSGTNEIRADETEPFTEDDNESEEKSRDRQSQGIYLNVEGGHGDTPKSPPILAQAISFENPVSLFAEVSDELSITPPPPVLHGDNDAAAKKLRKTYANKRSRSASKPIFKGQQFGAESNVNSWPATDNEIDPGYKSAKKSRKSVVFIGK